MKDGGLTVAELRPDHEAVAVPMDARMRAVVLMAFYNFFLADDVQKSTTYNSALHPTRGDFGGIFTNFPPSRLSPFSMRGEG